MYYEYQKAFQNRKTKIKKYMIVICTIMNKKQLICIILYSMIEKINKLWCNI